VKATVVSRTSRELTALRSRLADAEGALRAIRSGEADSVVVEGSEGPRVFTLEGAGDAYRLLIESMNEGALTVTAQGVILYANRCFAGMMRRPLEQVLGSPFQQFLSPADKRAFRRILREGGASGTKFHAALRAGESSLLTALLSINLIAQRGSKRPTFGIVVTDMTEARFNEDMLRTLTHRLMNAQDAERGNLALELHDNITQLLCAIIVRSQALSNSLSKHNGPSRHEAIMLRDLLGKVADEVERISRNLRPSVLNELGLVAVLRATKAEFEGKTGVSVRLIIRNVQARLSPIAEMTLYRIHQKALRNVEMHAKASNLTICLSQGTATVRLTITDDGVGFSQAKLPARGMRTGGLGLVRMRERAMSAGGTLRIRSDRGIGTTISVSLPIAVDAGGKRDPAGRTRSHQRPRPRSRSAPPRVG
jgi:two-component system NarL family sensor kinase